MGRIVPGIGYVEGYDEGIIPGLGYYDGPSAPSSGTTYYPVKLDKYQVPGFGNGTTKPTIGVEIDYSNPIANSLRGYVHVNNGVVVDVAKGKTYNVDSGLTASSNYVYNASPTAGLDPAIQIPYDNLYGGGFSLASIYIECTIEDSTVGPLLLYDEGGFNNGISIIYRTTPNKLSICEITGGTGASELQFDYDLTSFEGDGLAHKLFFTFDGTSWRFYFDGDLKATMTAAHSSIGFATTDSGILGQGGSGSVGATHFAADEAWTGKFFTLGRFVDCLSTSQVEELSDLSFQVLKPSIDYYAYIQQATAASVVYPVPLPKYMTPGFGNGATKPTIPVEIDESNPLAKHLAHFFIFKDGIAYDLVSGAMGVNNGVGFKNGTADFSGGTDYYSFPNDDIWLNTDSSLTVLFHIDIDSVPNTYNGLITPANVFGGTANSNIFLSTAGGYSPITFRALDSIGNITNLKFDSTALGTTVTGNHFWGVTYDGVGTSTTGWKTYKDNLVGDALSSSGTLVISETSIGRYSSGNEIDGRVYYIAIWRNRELSSDQVKAFRQKPYQVLKPSIDYYAYIQQAAAASVVYPVPLPKYMTPGFGNGRTKPTIPVLPDKSGLITALFTNSSFPPKSFDGPWTVPTTDTSVYSETFDATGSTIVVYDSGVADMRAFTSNYQYFMPNMDVMSIVVRFRIDATSNGQYAFTLYRTNTNRLQFKVNNTAAGDVRLYNDLNDYSTGITSTETPFAVGEWQWAMLRYDGTQWEVLVESDKSGPIITQVTSNGPSYMPAGWRLLVGGEDPAAGAPFTQRHAHSHLYVVDGVVSDAEFYDQAKTNFSDWLKPSIDYFAFAEPASGEEPPVEDQIQFSASENLYEGQTFEVVQTETISFSVSENLYSGQTFDVLSTTPVNFSVSENLYEGQSFTQVETVQFSVSENLYTGLSVDISEQTNFSLSENQLVGLAFTQLETFSSNVSENLFEGLLFDLTGTESIDFSVSENLIAGQNYSITETTAFSASENLYTGQSFSTSLITNYSVSENLYSGQQFILLETEYIQFNISENLYEGLTFIPGQDSTVSFLVSENLYSGQSFEQTETAAFNVSLNNYSGESFTQLETSSFLVSEQAYIGLDFSNILSIPMSESFNEIEALNFELLETEYIVFNVSENLYTGLVFDPFQDFALFPRDAIRFNVSIQRSLQQEALVTTSTREDVKITQTLQKKVEL